MRKKNILIIIVLVLIGAISYGVYVWNKPARDVVKENGLKVSAVEIFAAYMNDEAAADKLYLNKAIEVTGVVSEVKKNQEGKTVIYLQTEDPVFGINCTFKEEPGSISKGSTVTFKGICTGLLSDVIINQGVLVK